MSGKVTWTRHGKGYEISSKADLRFSPIFCKLEDGRTIEQHYQLDVKKIDPGGTDWRKGKGKPPKDPTVNLWEEYVSLWRRWVSLNPELFEELYKTVSLCDNILKDRFATTEVNQARALAFLINEKYYSD